MKSVLAYMPIVRAELPVGEVIGVDPSNREKPYFARCDVDLECGQHRATLSEGKRWNGCDIPWPGQRLLRWSRHDPRSLLASGFHDDGCEREDVPQVLADAVFVTLLRPIIFKQTKGGQVLSSQVLDGIGEGRAASGYVGVRIWSLLKLCGLVGRKNQ